MIKVGVFNQFVSPSVFMDALPALRKEAEKKRNKTKKISQGQLTLFDDIVEDSFDISRYISSQPTNIYSSSQLLEFEKELIGFYVTSRPSDMFVDIFNRYGATSFYEVSKEENRSIYDGYMITIGGRITKIKIHIDKKNRPMAFLDIEDYCPHATNIPVTIFAKQWESYQDLVEGDIVIVNGKIDTSYNGAKVLVDKILKLSDE